MSILIKGMEMPKGANMMLLISPDGDVWEMGDLLGDDKHLDSVKAVHVPPHGRLIDADRMKESIRKQSAFLKLMGGDLAEITETLEKGVLQEIANAPTIIQAEQAEEGE